jgi:hypothetical protein
MISSCAQQFRTILPVLLKFGQGTTGNPVYYSIAVTI